ncbi:transposase [Thalassolituus marinus]|uniref:Transposase n=1 Tax=Thalassolituus marinus TaxID=671053 RepID=A0ABS7ZU96_9GAMM|nr:transposase [Thalassolituus marinus]MCA6065241.1 transposase [Thalassolituus marinus]
MPKPRKQQVSIEDTPYYHCVSRCVRRAFLCGTDSVTGESYEHRRGWLENKLLELPQMFAIQIAAYAIMSNHYHVVLYVDSDSSKSWTDEEVIERWHSLFKGNLLSQRFMRGDEMNKADLARLQIYITEWRTRLTDISWFMRVLNESIAREANLEDDCTGRFWEGRFKSQALLDEAALAACMAYVDLNPVRACMAKTPEDSDHTSIKCRVEKAKTAHTPNHLHQQPKELLSFAGNPRQAMPKGIAMKLTDYLELVDATGRIIREDKRGFISDSSEKILERLGLDKDRWLSMTQNFENTFSTFAGNEQKLRSTCERLQYQRPPGLNRCRTAFG